MDYIKLFQEPDGSIQKTNEYIIQSGDSLSSIAKKLNIPINQLIQANKLENPDSIQAGQKLVIPIFKDREIAATEDYGREGWNLFNKQRYKETINPLLRVGPISAIKQLDRLLWYIPYEEAENEPQPSEEDKAMWERHLGFARDTTLMPFSNIRFMGDYNEDGSPKYPHAEYTGVSQETKDGIRQAIADETLKMQKNKNWTQVFDNILERLAHLSFRNPNYDGMINHTTHLGNYAIRENGNSGIYDIFDTYDFDNHLIPDREDGKHIEVRDTIHGPNAKPNLYNPLYTNEK